MEKRSIDDEILEYYCRMDYPIELIPLSAEEGGGWLAQIPCLGKYAFMAIRETAHGALDVLEKTKRFNFESYVEHGTPIPDPPVYED